MIDLRCPHWPRTKFAEAEPDARGHVQVACRTCKRAAGVSGLDVVIVHRFDVETGECIETIERTGKTPSL